MRNPLRWATSFALLLAAFFLTSGVADADELTVDTDVPVRLCGVTAVVGGSTATDCDEDPDLVVSADLSVPLPDLLDPVDVDLDVPVDLCGVGVAVLGDSTTGCDQPAAPDPAPAPAPQPDPAPAPPSGDAGANVAVDVPVDVCGIGVGVLGETAADCGTAPPPASDPAPAPDAGTTPSIGDVTAEVPVDVCGIGVSVLGGASADCGGTADPAGSDPAESDAAETAPRGGLIDTVVSVPIEVCGIDIGIGGTGGTTCAVAAASPTPEPEPSPEPEGPGEEPPAGDVPDEDPAEVLPIAFEPPRADGPTRLGGLEQQVGSDTLPHTGAAAAPVLAVGVAFLGTGLAARVVGRNRRA